MLEIFSVLILYPVTKVERFIKYTFTSWCTREIARNPIAYLIKKCIDIRQPDKKKKESH